MLSLPKGPPKKINKTKEVSLSCEGFTSVQLVTSDDGTLESQMIRIGNYDGAVEMPRVMAVALYPALAEHLNDKHYQGHDY